MFETLRMAPNHSKATQKDVFPTPNDWSRLAPDLGQFKRPLNVSLPCVGIDGAGFALMALKVPFSANNVYDLEKRYRQHLENHLTGVMHLGEDITKVPLNNFDRPVDMLISGPPCPPWAGNGKHQGIDDTRADVFLAIMRLLLCLIKTGELKAAVVENVKGILSKPAGKKASFMDNILTFLRKEAAEFDWQVVVLQAQDFCLAQKRCRVFLRGIRRSVGSGTVPEPLEPFGKKMLRDFLNPKLPSVNWSGLTTTMNKNLKDGEKEMARMLKDGEVVGTDILIFPLDRAEGKVYVRRFSKNVAPTLTTTNKYLFVASLDLDKEHSKRKFFRFLHPSERMLLQGFPADVLDDASDALRVHGSGNAYPVPVMMAVLAPILTEIKPALTNTWIFSPLVTPENTALCKKFDKFMETMENEKTTPKKRVLKKPAAPKPKVQPSSKKASTLKKKKQRTKKTHTKKQNPMKSMKVKNRSMQERQACRYRWLSSSSDE